MMRRFPLFAVVFVLLLAGCAGPIVQGNTANSREIEFRDVTNETGFTYTSQDSGIGNGNDAVYVADVNKDGWPDVLTLGGEEPAMMMNKNGTFTRRTSFPDVDPTIHSAIFLDYDNDGWKDLLLLPENETPILLQNQQGSFDRQRVGFDAKLTFPLGAAAADYNGDGCLDIFVIQSGDWAQKTPMAYTTVGRVTEDNGNPNYLYRGNCSTFERVEDAGISGTHWSLATSFVDLTGDGKPDIHVANDYYNDTLYVNTGDGFERRLLGSETDRNGMSSEVGFFNDDSRADVYVTNIYVPMDVAQKKLTESEFEILSDFMKYRLGKRAKGNSLLISKGDGKFSYAAKQYGVRKGGWGWAAVYSDLDNDGDQDLFHTTQTLVRIHEDDPKWTYPMIFERDGKAFERVDASSAGFGETDGRGVASLDYDRDGDIDLVTAQYNGKFRLYENVGAGENALRVRLRNNDSRTAIGAVVYVTAGSDTHRRVLNSRSDFLSQDSRMLHFGLGSQTSVTKIRIVWPDGSEQVLRGIAANQTVVINRSGVVETTSFANGTAD